MDHNRYKEILHLSFLGETDTEQENQLKAHLAECAECRGELDEYRKLDVFLDQKRKAGIPDSLLAEARMELRLKLREERNRESLLSRTAGSYYRKFKMRPGYVFSGAFSLAAGLVIGFFIFGKSPEPVIEKVPVMNAAEFSDNTTDIRNIKLSDPDPEDDQIEFSFDAVRRVNVSGSINDEKIRSMLLYVIFNASSPGVRLNSINALNVSEHQNYDPEIKEAIISAVKYDLNPGVRREALQVLKNFPYDQEIKKSYIYVILNDSSSAMRIDAINQLIQEGKTNAGLDKQEQEIFRDKLMQDENSYIRLRAKTVLQEYM